MISEAYTRRPEDIAKAGTFLSSNRELNENYWPNDGLEYRSCRYCGATEQCFRGAAPRLCGDCDDPELMEIYTPSDYSWLFAA